MPWKAGGSLLQGWMWGRSFGSNLSQCPGKRAAHCYADYFKVSVEEIFSLSQCPGKRAAHCYSSKELSIQGFLKSPQCPGKRAAHCYMCDLGFIQNTEPVSMPWKAGGSLLLLAEMATKTPQEIIVSMPWKAGGSLLQA